MGYRKDLDSAALHPGYGSRLRRILAQSPSGVTSDTEPDLSLKAVERGHVLTALEAAVGNNSQAARRLGISRKTLERKVYAWGRSPG